MNNLLEANMCVCGVKYILFIHVHVVCFGEVLFYILVLNKGGSYC